MRPGIQQAADQSEKFIAGTDGIHAGRTTAERNQLGLEFELIQVVEVQIGVAETNAGKHGIVLAEAAVSGDVDVLAMLAFFAQSGMVGGGADDQPGPGQGPRDGLHLFENQRGALIRHAHDQRGSRGHGRLALAMGIDARTRCVGNGKRVDEILLTVEERVKWNVVQHAMGHDHEVLGANAFAKRSHELLIKLGEMGLDRAEQGIGERLHVFAAEPEFRQLKLHHPEAVRHARDGSDGNDLKRVRGEDGGDELVSHTEVFDDGGVRRQELADGSKRGDGGSHRCVPFGLHGR